MPSRSAVTGTAIMMLLIQFCWPGTPPEGGYDPACFQGRSQGDLTVEPSVYRDVAAEWGKLVVRENRLTPASNLIEIAFLRLLSAASQKRPPVVYLAGTGTSGIAEGSGMLFPFFKELTKWSDVILLDTRGLGRSYPELSCSGEVRLPLERPITRADVLGAYKELLGSSIAYWEGQGVDIEAYNTRESSDDLRVLLDALGEPRATLVAFSYGTHLALNMIKRFPAHVHQAVLIGVEGPDHTYKLPSNIQRSVERISRLARSDTSVSKDLAGRMDRVLSRLGKQPHTAVIYSAGHGREVEVVLGESDLLIATKMRLKDREGIATLPAFYSRLEQGNMEELAGITLSARIIRPRSLVPFLNDCASGCSEQRRRRIENERSRYLLGDF